MERKVGDRRCVIGVKVNEGKGRRWSGRGDCLTGCTGILRGRLFVLQVGDEPTNPRGGSAVSEREQQSTDEARMRQKPGPAKEWWV